MATTPTTDDTPTHSRRWLLASGAAAAGAAAIAGCAINEPDPRITPVAGELPVPRVGQVPASDPASKEWMRTIPTEVVMDVQTIALPNKATPFVPTITVRAVHDDSTIGFRVEWKDSVDSDSAIGLDQFRDACAVLLAPGAGDDLLRTMGSATQAATLLHWKADWQKDIDSGHRQTIRDHAPNVVVDYYTPLKDNLTPTIEDYQADKAAMWLPGNYVDNPLALASHQSPVEKLLAKGFGTGATAATQNATGRGVRSDGGWRVALARPLAAADDGEVDMKPGNTYTVAFAVWAGSQRDAGSRKTPSKTVLRLKLEA